MPKASITLFFILEPSVSLFHPESSIMNFSRFSLLALALCCTFAACLFPQYTYKEIPEPRIYFGDGGGFSGAVTEYVLIENGQIFFTNSLQKDTCEVEPIRPRDAKNFFLRLDTLRLTKYDFYSPGNQYFFLRQTDEEVDHEVVWGRQDQPVRPDIQKFYDDLLETVKARPMLCPKEEKQEEKDPTYW